MPGKHKPYLEPKERESSQQFCAGSRDPWPLHVLQTPTPWGAAQANGPALLPSLLRGRGDPCRVKIYLSTNSKWPREQMKPLLCQSHGIFPLPNPLSATSWAARSSGLSQPGGNIYKNFCCRGANSRGGRAAAEEKESRPQGAYSLVFWREFLIPHSPFHIYSFKYLPTPSEVYLAPPEPRLAHSTQVLQERASATRLLPLHPTRNTHETRENPSQGSLPL